MQKAILITGFNNWGKTRLIHELFGKKRFFARKTHTIPSVNETFAVFTYSNDDFGEIQFKRKLQHVLEVCPNSGENLIVAFCPTLEQANDSRRILRSTPLDDYRERHILLLINKWDHQAILRANIIRQNLGGVARVTFHIIDGTTLQARRTQAFNVLRALFP